MGFPTAGYLENLARQEQDMMDSFEDWLAQCKILVGGSGISELTISTGAITPTGPIHSVDTEGDSGSDYLDNILATNVSDGHIIMIRNENDSRSVLVRHAQGGAGQVYLTDGLTVTLNDTDKFLVLMYKTSASAWYEVRFWTMSLINAVLTTCELKAYRETKATVSSSSGVLNIDCSTATMFTITLTEDITTVNYTNPGASGKVTSFALVLTQAATAKTVAWGASVKWAGGTAPDISTVNAIYILTFFTYDGGTTWFAGLAGSEMS